MIVTIERNQKDNGKKAKKEEIESKTAVASIKITETGKQTKLGLDVKKEENLAEWYSQVSFSFCFN